MKNLIYLLSVLISLNGLSQTTAVPDVNFEQELINLGLDASLDGVVLTANIDTVTSLNVGSKNISDLTGIEDFIAIETLLCGLNQLTILNVTQNTGLTSLNCDLNQLINLDVTQNTGLTQLYCRGNLLTSIDVTQNTGLTRLDCGFNLLTSINVTQNTGLTLLHCDWNQLTDLDLTQNTALTRLHCDNNLLNCLNVKNGNNFSLFGVNFQASNNPNLTCIEVDDVSYSTTAWSNIGFNIDAGVSFSTNCNNACSTVGVKENSIENLSVYPSPTTGIIFIDLGKIKTNLTATLINSLGQVVLIQKFESTNYFNINIDAPKGIYFLQLTNSLGEVTIRKIIKNSY